MTRMNCWDFNDCGRESGGQKSKEFGVCPAATMSKLDGVNEGKNGGRACWVLEGTMCGGEIQGTYSQKLGKCLECDFFAFVRGQQKDQYVQSRELFKLL